jgi:PAS domain S-box-containing protein
VPNSLDNKISPALTDEVYHQDPELYRSVINNISEVVFQISLEGIYLYLNPAWTAITGYSITETIGTNYVNYMVSDDPTEEYQHLFRQLINQEIEYIQYIRRCKTKSDNYRWIEIFAQPTLDKMGKVVSISGTFSDITIRKLIEEELKQKTALLEEMNQNLEKIIKEEVTKNRDKDLLLHQQSRQAAMGEMIGNIAHQWRQPLNAIGLIIQDIQDAHQFGELSAEYLGIKIQKANDIIAHMSQTIDDFRNFFRPEKAKRDFSLKEVISKTITFVEASFRNNGITIELDFTNDIVIKGYSNEYSQVLLNILNNAKDAHLDRKTKEPWVRVGLFAENERAVVTITDNAGGIPDSILSKVFEPYFTTKEPGKGTGIGLYMSKTIIEKNMGGILAVSNTDCGAEFRISI